MSFGTSGEKSFDDETFHIALEGGNTITSMTQLTLVRYVHIRARHFSSDTPSYLSNRNASRTQTSHPLRVSSKSEIVRTTVELSTLPKVTGCDGVTRHAIRVLHLTGTNVPCYPARDAPTTDHMSRCRDYAVNIAIAGWWEGGEEWCQQPRERGDREKCIRVFSNTRLRTTSMT